MARRACHWTTTRIFPQAQKQHTPVVPHLVLRHEYVIGTGDGEPAIHGREGGPARARGQRTRSSRPHFLSAPAPHPTPHPKGKAPTPEAFPGRLPPTCPPSARQP